MRPSTKPSLALFLSNDATEMCDRVAGDTHAAPPEPNCACICQIQLVNVPIASITGMQR